MKFVAMEGLPARRSYSNLRLKLDEFMSMNVKVVKVELGKGEYTKLGNAQIGLSRAAKRDGYPVNAHVINNELYLIRRDM